jgi:hypothetical protein
MWNTERPGNRFSDYYAAGQKTLTAEPLTTRRGGYRTSGTPTWRMEMKDPQPQTIELESGKIRFLEEMAAKYGLPDIGKAVRCLVNYARENPERHDEIFDEVRCVDC